jgi:hypothetical protein
MILGCDATGNVTVTPYESRPSDADRNASYQLGNAGYVSVDTRWVPLLIFDSDFHLLGSIAS